MLNYRLNLIEQWMSRCVMHHCMSCLPSAFCSGVIGVGFYGNENAHKGVEQFTEAARDIDSTIGKLKQQVSA